MEREAKMRGERHSEIASKYLGNPHIRLCPMTIQRTQQEILSAHIYHRDVYKIWIDPPPAA